jgi:hypothetical protein
MTRDEIKLVVFILSALVIGALVQHFRTRQPPPAPPEPKHGWARPDYVLKPGKSRRSSRSETTNSTATATEDR